MTSIVPSVASTLLFHAPVFISPRGPTTDEEILGKAKTVRELLKGAKYSIDYYQREYKWQTKQVAELIDDLAGKFLESHEAGNERSAGRRLRPLLPRLDHHQRQGRPEVHHRRPAAPDDADAAADLPAAPAPATREQKVHDRRADLLAEVRQAVVQPRHPRAHRLHGGALRGTELVDDRRAGVGREHPRALRRHRGAFPEELARRGAAVLRRLADRERAPRRDHRLLRRRRLHDLRDDERPRAVAHARGHAQGLPARQHRRRRRARRARQQPWKERVAGARPRSGKDEDADGIKSWLRSQYAEKHPRAQARRRARRTSTCIGTEFHRWVRDHEERLGLTASDDFARFIERDFAFYSRWYERLRRAAEALTPGPGVRLLQRAAQLHAAVPACCSRRCGSTTTRRRSLRKMRVVAAYLDILIHRRIWNLRSDRLLDDAVRDVPRHARHPRARAPTTLAHVLRERLDDGDGDLRQQRPLPAASA